MKKNYRYHLLKYKGRSSRLTCPGCGRPHCFTPYVDENDAPVDVERYGRCDHERSCGYNLYPPYEPNRQGGNIFALPKSGKRPVRRRKEPRKGLCLLPASSLTTAEQNPPKKKSSKPSAKCSEPTSPTSRKTSANPASATTTPMHQPASSTI